MIKTESDLHGRVWVDNAILLFLLVHLQYTTSSSDRSSVSVYIM